MNEVWIIIFDIFDDEEWRIKEIIIDASKFVSVFLREKEKCIDLPRLVL